VSAYAVSTTSTPALAAVIQSLEGRALHATCWIVNWRGTADSLRSRLRSVSSGPILVCALDGDWSC